MDHTALSTAASPAAACAATIDRPAHGVRALSVRRPWAHLIMAGHKMIENRTWSTHWRGTLVVHAGQRWERAGAELARDLGIHSVETEGACPGGYLGTVRLIDVHPATADCCTPWGQHGPGVYHWRLADPTPYTAPIPGPGRLGLYQPPAEVVGRRSADVTYQAS